MAPHLTPQELQATEGSLPSSASKPAGQTEPAMQMETHAEDVPSWVLEWLETENNQSKQPAGDPKDGGGVAPKNMRTGWLNKTAQLIQCYKD